MKIRNCKRLHSSSQADLVASSDFKKLDFDTNAEFHEFQCRIRSLEKLTNIDFSKIEEFDAFSP